MRVGIALPLALGVAACATAESSATAPGPPPFEGVRSVALVRFLEGPGGQRAKDALDALGESLAQRGYQTRVVEIGARSREVAGLERLFDRIQARMSTGAGRDRLGRGTGRGEEDAAGVLAALGVDAAAMVHRFDMPPPPPLVSPFRPPTGSVFDQPGPEWKQYRPIGALSLVNRAGHVVWFEWGTPPSVDPGVPANAAEAVDAALAVLSGREGDEP